MPTPLTREFDPICVQSNGTTILFSTNASAFYAPLTEDLPPTEDMSPRPLTERWFIIPSSSFTMEIQDNVNTPNIEITNHFKACLHSNAAALGFSSVEIVENKIVVNLSTNLSAVYEHTVPHATLDTISVNLTIKDMDSIRQDAHDPSTPETVISPEPPLKGAIETHLTVHLKDCLPIVFARRKQEVMDEMVHIEPMEQDFQEFDQLISESDFDLLGGEEFQLLDEKMHKRLKDFYEKLLQEVGLPLQHFHFDAKDTYANGVRLTLLISLQDDTRDYNMAGDKTSILICPCCEQEWYSRRDLIEHLEESCVLCWHFHLQEDSCGSSLNGGEPNSWTCPCCEKECSSRLVLIDHLQSSCVLCWHCHEEFSSPSHRDRHLKECESNPNRLKSITYPCAYCPARFPRKSKRNDHQEECDSNPIQNMQRIQTAFASI